MKKIYMMPLTEVTKIEAQKLMAGSLGSGEPKAFVFGDAPETEDADENLSRSSFWDDEE